MINLWMHNKSIKGNEMSWRPHVNKILRKEGMRNDVDTKLLCFGKQNRGLCNTP